MKFKEFSVYVKGLRNIENKAQTKNTEVIRKNYLEKVLNISPDCK